MGEYSAVVAEGMKRVCSAFTKIVAPYGFKRGKGRTWVRANGADEETIHFFRHGSTYGAPINASVCLRVILYGPGREQLWSDHVRRSTGYAYHHRFNAETGSTYERCLDELELFVREVAEPWFAERRTSPR